VTRRLQLITALTLAKVAAPIRYVSNALYEASESIYRRQDELAKSALGDHALWTRLGTVAYSFRGDMFLVSDVGVERALRETESES